MNHDAAPPTRLGGTASDPGQPVRISEPQPRRRPPFHPVVNLAFLLLTLVSTLIAGTLMTLDDFSYRTLVDIALNPGYWILGAPYAAGVMLILGVHEMGHYIACRYYRIDASLPFFLPAPHLFGTFGAVIRIRAPITNRRALFDIGVAGPLAGFVVAVPVLLIGLSRSVMIREPPAAGELMLTTPLLVNLLLPGYFPAEPGSSVRLDPVFMAAWLGLFATALNLLPIAQLDGGHMLYAIAGRFHRLVSRVGIWVLCIGGIAFGGWHLVTFGVLFLIIGPGHPPLIDETSGIGAGRIAIAVVALAIFLLCFIGGPPIRVVAG